MIPHHPSHASPPSSDLQKSQLCSEGFVCETGGSVAASASRMQLAQLAIEGPGRGVVQVAHVQGDVMGLGGWVFKVKGTSCGILLSNETIAMEHFVRCNL